MKAEEFYNQWEVGSFGPSYVIEGHPNIQGIAVDDAIKLMESYAQHVTAEKDKVIKALESNYHKKMQLLIELKEENEGLRKKEFGVINWVAVSEKLPPRPDEDYLVVVRNKNKDGGIPIQDIGNFSSDGVWIKHNTWEDVIYWAELPNPPEINPQ